MNTKPETKTETKPETKTETKERKTMNTKPETKPETVKRIDAALQKLASAEYVRKGVSADELEALTAIVPHLASLSGDIDAAGGAKVNAIVRVTRYSAVNGWQTLAAFPVDVHSTKVCPAGTASPETKPEWYVLATASDTKAYAAGNSNRVVSVKVDGKVMRFKGNAANGKPVKTKLALNKYFKEHVGAAMRDAFFDALPSVSVNHETDTAMKTRKWQIELIATKTVSVGCKN